MKATNHPLIVPMSSAIGAELAQADELSCIAAAICSRASRPDKAMREHVRFVICLAALGGSWAENVCISASNAVRFTNHIYGCDAAWSSPGVASASAVCGSAAHICTSLEEIQARGLADGGCTSMAPEGKAYLTLLAGFSGGATRDCSQASNRGSNDIWACAKDGNGVSWRHGGSCGALDRIVGDVGTRKAGFSWASHMDELGGMVSDGSSGGVLCCSDDPTTVLTPSPPGLTHSLCFEACDLTDRIGIAWMLLTLTPQLAGSPGKPHPYPNPQHRPHPNPYPRPNPSR